MNNDSHVRLGIPVCLAILSVAATLIGSGGRQVSGQANLVRVVSPADLVLQPRDPVTGTVKVDFEYDPRVAYVMLSAGAKDAPHNLSATEKSLHSGLCGLFLDLPGDLRYDAFDSASARIGKGTWDFQIGTDTTKPSVRIVSPKNGTMVAPGDTIEIVVAGEQSQTATTCLRRLTLVDPALNT